MEKNPNKYISVAYELYSINNGEENFEEKATEDQPFQFISGFGTTIPAFEKQIETLEKGDKFDFILSEDDAYGKYMEEHVLNLEKNIFTINGHFDAENIYVNAIVPLQNADGNKFYGKVLSITDDVVQMDLNPPLAGKDIRFKGSVMESRVATNDEIQAMVNRLSGEDSGCSCGGSCDGGCGNGCGGGCEGDHDHKAQDGGCECGGHCH